jgi:hypothetical protein
MYITDQAIRLTFEPNLVTGEDMTQKNGCGAIKVALKEFDVPNRYNLTLQLTYPDPEIFHLLVGGNLYMQMTNVIGYQAPPLGSVDPGVQNGTGLEFWTKRTGPGGQMQDYPWWHFIFPKCYWQPASRTAEAAPMVTEYTGYAVENVNYGHGPQHTFTLDTTRVYQVVMETTMPAASCGAQATTAS